MLRLDPKVKDPRRKQDGLLIGAAVGSGLTAQTAARGGADFLLAVNAGRMRIMGAPSIASMLPCHDATRLTEDFAEQEVLPRTDIPTLLGVHCWDADYVKEKAVDRIRELGFAGAVNFPNATLMPRGMTRMIDQAGRGPAAELELLQHVQKRGLLALYYCGTKANAKAAAEAGIAMILLNFGWNAGGTDGHSHRSSLEEVGVIARDYSRLIRRISPSTRILLEGGPVVSADDLGQVAAVAELDGYVGGSTLDRLPFEESVLNRIASYRNAADRRRQLSQHQEMLLRWAALHKFVGTSPALLKFLEKLYALSRTCRSIAVTLERGTPTAPIVSALGVGLDAPQLDLTGGDIALQIDKQLFGRPGPHEKDGGLLTDPGGGTLLIRNIHLALSRVQRRLARSLLAGRLVTTRRRRRIRLTTRCIFLFDVSLAEPGLPASLDPELAHYLDGWRVEFPPLRERLADIPNIIETVSRTNGVIASRMPSLSEGAIQQFRSHGWPGNEAELEQIVGRMLRSPSDKKVDAKQAAEFISAAKANETVGPLEDDLERLRVVEALWRNGFHKGRTAHALNMSRKTLYNRMKSFGLKE